MEKDPLREKRSRANDIERGSIRAILSAFWTLFNDSLWKAILSMWNIECDTRMASGSGCTSGVYRTYERDDVRYADGVLFGRHRGQAGAKGAAAGAILSGACFTPVRTAAAPSPTSNAIKRDGHEAKRQARNHRIRTLGPIALTRRSPRYSSIVCLVRRILWNSLSKCMKSRRTR